MTHPQPYTNAAGPNMRGRTIPFRDKEATAQALPFPALVDALAEAAVEFATGGIRSALRLSVPLAGQGVSLSMPASSSDIAIHKLANVQPANATRNIPSIHGVVTVSDAVTGQSLCFLDGPELTGRRTAGISLLGIRTFLAQAPQQVLLIGTGVQAAYHAAGLRKLYPACRILVKGIDRASEALFCDSLQDQQVVPCPTVTPQETQVVITLTTRRATFTTKLRCRVGLSSGWVRSPPKWRKLAPLRYAEVRSMPMIWKARNTKRAICCGPMLIGPR